MRNRFLLLPACLTVMSLSGFVHAQAPSTQPTDDSNRPPRWMGGPPGDRGFGDHNRRANRNDTITDDEWADVSQFMEENFQNRWAVYKNITSKPGREMLAREMKQRIVSRHRQLERIRQSNPGLYDVAIAQARADDEVWGAVKAWQELSESAPETERDAAQKELRQRVRGLLEKTLEDREARLANLRKMIQRENEQLDADRKQIDRLVNERVEQLTSDNPFRGPDGMGPAPDGMDRREGEPGRPPGPGRPERRGGFPPPPDKPDSDR